MCTHKTFFSRELSSFFVRILMLKDGEDLRIMANFTYSIYALILREERKEIFGVLLENFGGIERRIEFIVVWFRHFVNLDLDGKNFEIPRFN